MGLMGQIMGVLFGGGRNVVAETAGVFRINAENAAVRASGEKAAAMQQYAAEFAHPRRGGFDRFIDGLNRLPRPMLAFGTIGLFVSAMVDPIWFASRMQGVVLVPEPLWWLMGAIVSFYFGARHQVKSQEFQSSIAETMSRTEQVTRNLSALDALEVGAQKQPMANAPAAPSAPIAAQISGDIDTSDNAALADWQATRG